MVVPTTRVSSYLRKHCLQLSLLRILRSFCNRVRAIDRDHILTSLSFSSSPREAAESVRA